MATIKDYLDYAELAQASYGTFTTIQTYSEYLDELKKVDVEFSPTQAKNFANRYEVKAVADSLPTGLDAVLFYDHKTDKYVLSIRGTSSLADVYSDILLATDGVAYEQMMALNSFYNQWLLDGTIPVGTKLDVTGHSLGGALAQIFTVQHPSDVANTYTYNAPGIGGLSVEAYEKLGITSGDITDANITNIYAQEGIEATSGLGTMVGTVIPISIDNVDPLSNHRIPYTTESLHIYDMLSSITNTQDIDLLTTILEHTTNEKAISIVSDVFKYDVSGDSSIIDKAIDLTDNNQSKATGLTNLYDKTPTQLNQTNKANLYALLNLTPFAIQGNLPAYNDIDVKDYSDTYLEKRSEMLYYTMHPESKNTGNGTYYQDDTLNIYTQDKLMVNYANGTSLSDAVHLNEIIYGDKGDDISEIVVNNSLHVNQVREAA